MSVRSRLSLTVATLALAAVIASPLAAQSDDPAEAPIEEQAAPEPAPEPEPVAEPEAAPQPEQPAAVEPEPEPEPAQQAEPEPQPAPEPEQPAAAEPEPAPAQQAEPEAPAAPEQPAAAEQPAVPVEPETAQPEPEEGAPAEQQAAPAEEPKPVLTPETVLADERPAAVLTDAELRERARAARELAGSDATPRDQRRALRAKAEADGAELSGRIAAQTGVHVESTEAAAEEARKIADDARPAGELSDDDLRERIKLSRGVLAVEGAGEAEQRRVRERLGDDSAEIRRRVSEREGRERRPDEAAAEQGRSDDLPWAGRDQVTADDLLADRRPGRELTSRALQRRIDADRRAMAAQGLDERRRRSFEDRLRDDRHELRGRLSDRRDRRRGRIDDPAFGLGLAVGAIASAVILARPTIAVAEAYDEELEEWMVAPPLVRTEHRYRVEDFRTQPRLRYAVPGIEVDTVRFGFGESFLREEEVPKLDRIGEIIERIVARNPDEVFLIEGHTDAVGSDAANLALSLQRAEAVREALTEYYLIEPRNLEVVGHGERYLRIPTDRAEPENRRVTLRRITPLLAGN